MSLYDTGVNLSELAKTFNLDISSYTEIEMEDMLERAHLGDIDGIAVILNVGIKRAKQIALYLNESKERVRSILRTPDSRRLRNDLLSIFSLEASSEITKNRILLRIPTLNQGKIIDKFSLCGKGFGIFSELVEKGRINWIKKELASISIDIIKPKERKMWNDSDIITYFIYRLNPIDVLYKIQSECSDVKSLESHFNSVDLQALGKIRETIKEVRNMKSEDPEGIISDLEIEINERIKQKPDEETIRQMVEEAIIDIAVTLRMNEIEEERLRRAAFQGLSIPFEFDRVEMISLISDLQNRKSQKKIEEITRIEEKLKEFRNNLKNMVKQLVTLDQLLAIATVAKTYELTIPDIIEGGIGFIEGQNLILARDLKNFPEKKIQLINYSVGSPESTCIIPSRNTVLLTGANSGGKTTLLTTMAEIHILTLLGLPVPAKKAEVTPIPIYLFRKRTTRKIGSLENALSSLIPVFTERKKKIILIDEIEALTEPGAAGRIIATLLTKSASGGSFLLLITHLARETIPHVRLPIRVDGIEAKGLNVRGDLDVNRQPKFNHVGSSTPKLILMKLARETKHTKTKEIYNEVLASLENQSGNPMQTPITLPWSKEK